MLGGIVVAFLIFAPFIALALAAIILIGMVWLGIYGFVESRRQSVEPATSITPPEMEKAS